MLLSEYQTHLAEIINRFARTDLIVTIELTLDARTPKIGMIKGSLAFVDGTQLYFSEYVDVRYRIEKLSYVYHVQDTESKVVFRYDNAAHKPALPYACHKHTATGKVKEADPPDLEDILNEIIERFIP